MNVHTKKHGDVSVVQPVGRLDSVTAATFERALDAVFDGGCCALVLDFSQIDYISSAGLRSTLVAGKRMGATPGGRLVLCGLGEQVREIFELSGFAAIFSIRADLDSALGQFSGSAAAAGEGRHGANA